MSISEKLDTIAENVSKVHNAGKRAEYDAFWDGFQQNGRATDYSSSFSRNRFNDATLRPKYDIKPINCNYMFAYNGYNAEDKNFITDIAECFEKAGIVFDTSSCTNFGYMFYVATEVTRIPEINVESCTHLEAFFTNCHKLKTIDCLTLRKDGTNTWTTDIWGAPFQACNALANIKIEGTIGMSISFQHSPLTATSIVSIIEHLSDTASGMNVTFKRSAVNTADWHTTNYASWDDLVAIKPNWTISLV